MGGTILKEDMYRVRAQHAQASSLGNTLTSWKSTLRSTVIKMCSSVYAYLKIQRPTPYALNLLTTPLE